MGHRNYKPNLCSNEFEVRLFKVLIRFVKLGAGFDLKAGGENDCKATNARLQLGPFMREIPRRCNKTF
jgi:hypothetical protein